jgi:hypothetical protein
MATLKGCKRRDYQINYGVDTRGKKKKRTSKENVDGRRMSSQGNKTSRSRSVVKQKGMVFGFRKTATAVLGPEIEEGKSSPHESIFSVFL